MTGYGSTATVTETKTPVSLDKILERGRKCFKLANEAGEKQRQREKDDLMFQVPELQWDEAARQERMGRDGIPARPCLSINKIDQPLQLVDNQMRSADLGINIHPISEDADDDTAEMIQGLIRQIERKSRAELARSWAFQRADRAGFGVYRVDTAYDEEGGHPTHQKIVIRRILHQEGVFFDPSAQEPDLSDGKWAFVCTWMTPETFNAEHPNAKLDTANNLEWEALREQAPDWVRDEDILVCEYWYKEIKTQRLCLLDNGKVIDKDVEKLPRGRKIEREFEREDVKVFRCVMTGTEALEEPQEWPGRWIPLIPVIGRELIPFDGERRYVGMIRNARDGQRLYNMGASVLVERMAMEPKTPFIGYAGQFTDPKWKHVNTRNYGHIEVDARPDGAGGILPIPQRAQLDQTGMSLAMMAIQEGDQFIQATTSVYDPSLGRDNSRDKSGKAILALQQQADAGTSHYLQSLADVSMTYEARVILNLIPHVYDAPGRVTSILRGDDGKSEKVMLNAPFTIDPKTKRPRRAGKGDKNPKNYDLRAGVYGVSVSIGKSFQTRLEQGQSEIGEILTAKPELIAILGDLYFRFRDFPGAKEIADRLAKVREKQYPGLGEGEDGEIPPEQLQAQNQALQQQVQQLDMMLKQAAEELRTEQAKQQATIQKAQMDAQASVQRSEMDNATRMEIARQNNETKIAIAQMEARLDRISKALDHANETRGRHEEMAHDVAMAAAGGNTMTRKVDQGQEQGMERSNEESMAPGQQEASE